MNAGKVILITLGGAAAVYGIAYLVRQSQLAQNTTFDVTGYTTRNLSLQSADMDLYAKVGNLTTMDFNVTSQNFQIYMNDVLVGNINNTNAITLPKMGTVEIKIPITFNPSKALGVAIQSLLASFDFNNVKFRITGYMAVSSMYIMFNRFPLDVTFTLADLIKK